jgi:hypothetical protein
MQHLDADYVDEVLRRIDAIPDDAVPRWGKLRKPQLIEHLIWTVEHAMGRSKQLSFRGNWFTRRILAPVILSGFIRMPKNVRLPKRLEAQGITLREPGNLDTLSGLLDEYIALVQADELHTAMHPIFGDIGIDGWERMHILHFEHHLRQFGV